LKLRSGAGLAGPAAGAPAATGLAGAAAGIFVATGEAAHVATHRSVD
jgi:hypothetical protein